MRFSQNEKKDLFYAGLLISIAFAILLSGGYKSIFGFEIDLIYFFFISFFTAGTGFLLHELMHKYVATKYGLYAEFKAFYNMLWLAVLFSLFGFIFAAPGAVFISGFINVKRNGKISLAGPVSNIVLALLFLSGGMIYSFLGGNNSYLVYLFNVGLSINSLLALFNMIPVMPFDGAKIITWDKTIYFITLVASLALFIFSLIY